MSGCDEQCPASPTFATQKKSKATGFGSTYTPKPKESYQKKLSSSSTKSEPLKKLSTLSNKSTKSEPGSGKSSSNQKPKSGTHREIWAGPKKWKSARMISNTDFIQKSKCQKCETVYICIHYPNEGYHQFFFLKKEVNKMPPHFSHLFSELESM